MDKNHQNIAFSDNDYTGIKNPFVNTLKEVDLQPTKKKLNPRNDILKQIYAFYDTEQEVVLTKRANWKRYIETLKKQKVKDSQEQQRAFKKSKLFIRKMSPSSMAFFLSHIPTKDLWYILSVVKDKSFRNESVGAYIKSLIIK